MSTEQENKEAISEYNDNFSRYTSLKKLLLSLIKNKWALASVIWLIIVINVAIFASQIVPHDPNRNNIMEYPKWIQKNNYTFDKTNIPT